MQGVWVRSLVKELSHMACNQKNKTKNRSNVVTNSIKTLKKWFTIFKYLKKKTAFKWSQWGKPIISVFMCYKFSLPMRMHLCINTSHKLGFPGGTSGSKPACQCRRHKRRRFDPWVGKIPWRRTQQPTSVFLPGKSHGQRNLVGYKSIGLQRVDMIEVT